MSLLPFERRWLLAVFAAMLPSGVPDGTPVGAEDPRLARYVDDVMATAPGETRLGVRLALWIVTLAPLAWRLRLRPFPRLTAEDRVAFLDAMAGSRFYVVRELPNLLKILACSGWAGLPEVQAAMGLPHPETRPPAWLRDAP